VTILESIIGAAMGTGIWAVILYFLWVYCKHRRHKAGRGRRCFNDGKKDGRQRKRKLIHASSPGGSIMKTILIILFLAGADVSANEQVLLSNNYEAGEIDSMLMDIEPIKPNYNWRIMPSIPDSTQCLLCEKRFAASSGMLLVFPVLKGSPAACFKCLFRRVTGKDIDWSDETKARWKLK